MYIEIQYYDLLAVLSYYTISFIECYVYRIVYIWPVATHGHDPSIYIAIGLEGNSSTRTAS
jgi:hypothetical protein